MIKFASQLGRWKLTLPKVFGIQHDNLDDVTGHKNFSHIARMERFDIVVIVRVDSVLSWAARPRNTHAVSNGPICSRFVEFVSHLNADQIVETDKFLKQMYEL